jgi:AcrR family transcriptional regulator
MKLTLTALTVAASLMASGAYAFDPDDLRKMKDEGHSVTEIAELAGVSRMTVYRSQPII